MPKFEKLTLPNEGEIITFNQGKPNVPNNPIVPFIRVMVLELIFGLQLKSFLIQRLKKAMEMKEKLIGLKSMQVMKLVNFMEHIIISLKIPLKQSDTLVSPSKVL